MVFARPLVYTMDPQHTIVVKMATSYMEEIKNENANTMVTGLEKNQNAGDVRYSLQD